MSYNPELLFFISYALDLVSKNRFLFFPQGLSIKVVAAQIPHFQHPHGVWLRGDALTWHSILVIASALIIEYFPKLAKGSILPSPLVALGLAAISAETLDLPVPKLVDIVGPEAFEGGVGTLMQAIFPFASTSSIGGGSAVLPQFRSILTLEKIFAALPTAVEMAIVGLLQSLLTLQIVDEITHTRGKNTKESIAQGLGNLLSGSIGGMGGSALLGQSLVNVHAGGTGRLSSIAVAVFVLAGITLFAPILGAIPVAALVGLMLTVAQHTFSWTILGDVVKGRVPWADIVIVVSVTMTTAFVNMAAAVALGVLASALRFAWQASCNMSARETGKGTPLNHRYIRVQGPLFFGSALTFQKLCDPSARDREMALKHRSRFLLAAKKKELKQADAPFAFSTGRETVIDFLNSQVWDHAAMMAIEAICKHYHELGVKLHLRHLSPDCREKLLEGSDVGEWSTELNVDPSSDPSYQVGVDPQNKP
jgi:SulP family sulfate permease